MRNVFNTLDKRVAIAASPSGWSIALLTGSTGIICDLINVQSQTC